jgi:hypothetical protein
MPLCHDCAQSVTVTRSVIGHADVKVAAACCSLHVMHFNAAHTVLPLLHGVQLLTLQVVPPTFWLSKSVWCASAAAAQSGGH